MFIEKLDRKRLKVELSGSDLTGLEMEVSSFAHDSDHSRTIIKAILRKAYEQTGFLYTNCSLQIEVFPQSNRGCLILFTKIVPRKPGRLKLTAKPAAMVFVFDDLYNLFDCAQMLNQAGITENNKLYFYGGRHYLAAPAKLGNRKRVYMILSEFGSGKCLQNEAVLAEYGELVCEDVVGRICGVGAVGK